MSRRDEAQVEFTWLSPKEFGRRAAGVSADTVRRSIHAGEIPAEYVQKTRGGQLRISPDGLAWWLENHKVEGDAAAA